MKCPKCGNKQISTIECESCGIIFAKYRQLQETQQEMPALRTAHKPSKQPPYTIIGVASVFLALLLILMFTGGEESIPMKPVATTAKPVEVVSAPTEDETKYRYYKKYTGYNLDRTFLRNQPTITHEYIEEFNYRWIVAYNCEYSAEIQKDKSRFYEIMRKTMDDELKYRNSYPAKYQSSGDVSVKLISKDRNEVMIKPYIQVKTHLSAQREKKGPGCNATRSMNTRHGIRFAPLLRDLTVEVPQRLLDKIDFPERGFELEAEIKFRIDDSSYEYYKSQKYFRVRHKAVVEELVLLNNDNASREDRIMMTLNESQLY